MFSIFDWCISQTKSRCLDSAGDILEGVPQLCDAICYNYPETTSLLLHINTFLSNSAECFQIDRS